MAFRGRVPSPTRLRFPRAASDRVLFGVAGGLARSIGVDPTVVRVGFLVLSLAAGAGIVFYAVCVALSRPAEIKEPPVASAHPEARATPSRRDLACALLVVAALIALREAGLWPGDALVVPVALALAGWTVLRSERAPHGMPSSRAVALREALSRQSGWRVAAGALLVVAGMTAFIAAHGSLETLGSLVLAAGSTTAGLLLMFGSWGARLLDELAEERRQRIRSEERAEVAAHLHDSVLQTLALIQRSAHSPRRMAALARVQERELRAWLWGASRPSAGDSIRGAVEAMGESIERDHEVTVEVIVVGDAPMDDRARAVLGACREACVNAAMHSGSEAVAAYVEVEAGAITCYVRDRGSGFAPEEVPPDRQGIAESIRARIQRQGGWVEVRSAPGEGTEVQMRVPREVA